MYLQQEQVAHKGMPGYCPFANCKWKTKRVKVVSGLIFYLVMWQNKELQEVIEGTAPASVSEKGEDVSMDVRRKIWRESSELYTVQ